MYEFEKIGPRFMVITGVLAALSTTMGMNPLSAETLSIRESAGEPVSVLPDEAGKSARPEISGLDAYATPSMANITNVSQLRDVSPQDWAYEALQSLIERYGCLAGYPDQSFRGGRLLTRLEFTAGLNACLNTLERLFQQNVSVAKEDIEKLERLAQEFASELATLGARIEGLEARTAFLEDHQFSTTSKLFGSLRVQTNAYFSGEGQDGRPQVNMQYNMFLATITSFTGRDSLVTGLGITNTRFAELANTNDGREVGSTREGASDTTDSGDTGGSARLITLQYLFPVDERLNINIIAANRFRFDPVLLSQFVPYYRLGGGPTSTFASAPPIYLVGGGSGANVNYKLFDSTVLNLTYFSTFANEPNPAKGLFNGDYVMVAQINYNPTPSLFLQLLYQKGYFGPGNFGFNNGQTFRGNGFVGTALANRFDDAGVLFEEASAVSSNAYLIGGYYAITPKVVVGGWANLINARLLGKGDADIWTYSAQVAFPDLFKEGNQGGLIVGVEPMLTSLQSEIPYANFKKDTSLHIEAYYKYMVNNNFSITPSLIWITAPNQDADNRDIIVGGIRTTFDF